MATAKKISVPKATRSKYIGWVDTTAEKIAKKTWFDLDEGIYGDEDDRDAVARAHASKAAKGFVKKAGVLTALALTSPTWRKIWTSELEGVQQGENAGVVIDAIAAMAVSYDVMAMVDDYFGHMDDED